MPKHLHADVMTQYAADAQRTENPWELWEHRDRGETDGWRTLTGHPLWGNSKEYRRKPRTLEINGIKVAGPLREAPREGVKVYVPSLARIPFSPTPYVLEYTWCDEEWHRRMLADGALYATPEEASNAAKALLSFTKEDQT